jgi:hypothetical protein
MGADLIINTLAVERGRELDWSQVEPALAAMSDEAVAKTLDEAGIYEDETGDPRESVRTIFKDLKRILEHEPRDLTWLVVRDLLLYQSGGMSWGDAPTDSSTVLYEASCFESILEAVGFCTNWWEAT